MEREFFVPAEGADTSAACLVENPVKGGVLKAQSDVDWISNINCGSADVAMSVAPNDSRQERTAVMTVVYEYGDGDTVCTEFNIVQACVEIDADYVLEATEFNGVYFGSQYGHKGEHCYNVYLSDKPMENSYMVDGGTYYLFDLFTVEPENSLNPQPAPGTYILGEDRETESMTFTPDNSCRFYQRGTGMPEQLFFTAGTLEISYEGDVAVYDAVLTDTEGKVHHVSYTGQSRFIYDGMTEFHALEQDLDFEVLVTEASWLANAGDLMEISITFTDMNLDGDGYIIPPGSILYVDVFMPFNENGELTPGTYSFDNKPGTANSLCPGEMTQESMYPSGTYADYIDESEIAYTGLISSGKMTVSGNAGNYGIECEFVTAEGHSVKCTYSGLLVVKNLPEGFSTLTQDYKLDLSATVGEIVFWGDYYEGGENWMIYLDPSDGVTGDAFMAEIVVPDGTGVSGGIPTGTYKPASGLNPLPGEYVTGQISSDGNSFIGTMYLGDYVTDGQQTYPRAFAPAISGDLNIVNLGNGAYELSFTFMDDKGHEWTGEWSGNMAVSDGTEDLSVSKVCRRR
ncbi:MAG TPA: hypothetical protein IAC04_07610 [Candidatus Coprenecus stercoravium]|uniref:BACON domain-containing protein n=1 Tax=Candidatus Coprenecus stercoravium TaxID=2840735 RepID=A0A9D2GRY7_9BACT|nr:hypothetical protein [Candidatus Coprenecus stercoravium]